MQQLYFSQKDQIKFMIITLTKERVEELVSPYVDVSSQISPWYLIAVSDTWMWTKCAVRSDNLLQQH